MPLKVPEQAGSALRHHPRVRPVSSGQPTAASGLPKRLTASCKKGPTGTTPTSDLHQLTGPQHGRVAPHYTVASVPARLVAGHVPQATKPSKAPGHRPEGDGKPKKPPCRPGRCPRAHRPRRGRQVVSVSTSAPRLSRDKVLRSRLQKCPMIQSQAPGRLRVRQGRALLAALRPSAHRHSASQDRALGWP